MNGTGNHGRYQIDKLADGLEVDHAIALRDQGDLAGLLQALTGLLSMAATYAHAAASPGYRARPVSGEDEQTTVEFVGKQLRFTEVHRGVRNGNNTPHEWRLPDQTQRRTAPDVRSSGAYCARSIFTRLLTVSANAVRSLPPPVAPVHV